MRKEWKLEGRRSSSGPRTMRKGPRARLNNCDGNPGSHFRELFQKEVHQVVVGGREGKT